MKKPIIGVLVLVALAMCSYVPLSGALSYSETDEAKPVATTVTTKYAEKPIQVTAVEPQEISVSPVTTTTVTTDIIITEKAPKTTETEPEIKTEKETTTAKTETTTTETQLITAIPEPVLPKPSYTIPVERYDNYLFIGDSRTVGMSYFCPGWYIAKSAEGINWFYNNYEEITSYRNYNVVINLGVNDLWDVWNYVQLYNSLPDDFVTSNNIIIMAVNPCDGNYSSMNADIDWFNSNLAANLTIPCEFIDTNYYLNYIGFSTVDGLHYTGQTYVDIYNAVLFGY